MKIKKGKQISLSFYRLLLYSDQFSLQSSVHIKAQLFKSVHIKLETGQLETGQCHNIQCTHANAVSIIHLLLFTTLAQLHNAKHKHDVIEL